ncbi:MAG: lipoyl synthase [Candidatus Micrarchaeota archaeon]
MVCTLPPWLKIRAPSGKQLELFNKVSDTLKINGLHTICESGKCPNRGECWSVGTATFLIMGNVCTRGCRFCNTPTAVRGLPLDKNEPKKIAAAVKNLKLKYVVITSVDRDDLPDQGSVHIAETISAIKKNSPVVVEALIPDFRGDRTALEQVVKTDLDVLGHNIEVVKELQKIARDRRANYEQSLTVLANAKKINSKLITKSSIMVGLGETQEQIEQAMDDVLLANVDILTIGQYLRPSKICLPVKEYVTPERFLEFEKIGMKKGFGAVISGPFVRSSYKAAELIAKNLIKKRK